MIRKKYFGIAAKAGGNEKKTHPKIMGGPNLLEYNHFSVSISSNR